MKHLILTALAGVALMACTPKEEPAAPATDTASVSAAEPAPPASGPADPATQPAGEDTCNKAVHAGLIGKPATDPAVPPAGPSVRHIRPDTQVTMDFRADRLNIDIDANGIITGLRCT